MPGYGDGGPLGPIHDLTGVPADLIDDLEQREVPLKCWRCPEMHYYVRVLRVYELVKLMNEERGISTEDTLAERGRLIAANAEGGLRSYPEHCIGHFAALRAGLPCASTQYDDKPHASPLPDIMR